LVVVVSHGDRDGGILDPGDVAQVGQGSIAVEDAPHTRIDLICHHAQHWLEFTAI
jgi:hypothetical protein